MEKKLPWRPVGRDSKFIGADTDWRDPTSRCDAEENYLLRLYQNPEPGRSHERAKLSYTILSAEDLSLNESRIIRRTCFLKPLLTFYPLRIPLLNNSSNETLWMNVQRKTFSSLDSYEMRIFDTGCLDKSYVRRQKYIYTRHSYMQTFSYIISIIISLTKN